MALDLTDTINYPHSSWTRGLFENRCHDSKQLITFQSLGFFVFFSRGNGCDVCTRTSVSTVKCSPPARNLRHRIGFAPAPSPSHWERTLRDQIISQRSHFSAAVAERITGGDGDFVYRSDRG